MVTEQELKSLLQANGWYLAWTKKYKTRYLAAKRRKDGKMVSRYLITENKLPHLTKEDVLKKLNI